MAIRIVFAPSRGIWRTNIYPSWNEVTFRKVFTSFWCLLIPIFTPFPSHASYHTIPEKEKYVATLKNLLLFTEYEDLELKDLVRLATIGVGGFGRVVLVRNKKETTTLKVFALKQMKKVHIVETKQEEHVFNERRILLSCEWISEKAFIVEKSKILFQLPTVLSSVDFSGHFATKNSSIFFLKLVWAAKCGQSYAMMVSLKNQLHNLSLAVCWRLLSIFIIVELFVRGNFNFS